MDVLILSLVIAILAVARVTRLLVEDQLMVGYRRWVVRKWGETSLASYLAHCAWCTSVWVAAPILPIAVLFPNRWVIALFSIPAASMVAGILLERKE